MGIFSKVKKFLSGPEAVAPQLGFDSKRLDDVISPLSTLANKDIDELTKAGVVQRDAIRENAQKSLDKTRALGKGNLDAAIASAGLQGGIGSGAQERASRRSERNISEAQQEGQADALQTEAELAAADFGGQIQRQFQAQRDLPLIELKRLGIKTGIDAGNIAGKNIADTQNQLGKRKFGTSLGNQIGGPVAGMLGGGLFS